MFKSKRTLYLLSFTFLITLLLLTQTNTHTSAQTSSNLIPFIYQNNVWLADPDNLTLQQITTDATKESIYTNVFLSPSGQYIAYEKRVNPLEYNHGAITYTVYDLQIKTMVERTFPTEYIFSDLSGRIFNESYTLLGWLYNSDTLLIAKELNNCNQDKNKPRTLEILSSPPPFTNLTLQTTHIGTDNAIRALNLINSPQNWVNYLNSCCNCSPADFTHFNYLSLSGQTLNFQGYSLQTTSVKPSPNDKLIAYASSSGSSLIYYDSISELGTSTLKIADISAENPIALHSLNNYHIDFDSIQWSPNSQNLAFITFDINNNEEVIIHYVGVTSISGAHTIILNTPPVSRFYWSPDSTKLLLISGNIIIYDLNTQISHTFQQSHKLNQ